MIRIGRFPGTKARENRKSPDLETPWKKKEEEMTGNRVRQARFAEKMRAKGKKKLTLWVTKEDEQFIRAFLLDPDRLEREREETP
jgi:hypothetical protein